MSHGCSLKKIKENWHTRGKGWFSVWGARDGNPFATHKTSYKCDKKGRRKGGGKGGITEKENDTETQAISQWESRPDTSASIIQITTVNERDPNKSPPEFTGRTVKHFPVQSMAFSHSWGLSGVRGIRENINFTRETRALSPETELWNMCMHKITVKGGKVWEKTHFTKRILHN